MFEDGLLIPHLIDIVAISIGVGVFGYYLGVVRTMNKYVKKEVDAK